MLIEFTFLANINVLGSDVLKLLVVRLEKDTLGILLKRENNNFKNSSEILFVVKNV